MEKEFIPYELAVKMKALGFDEPCIAKFINKQFAMNVAARWYKHNSNEITSGWISAPTFSQAFRWFREKYNLYSQLEYFHSPKWTYSILEFTDLKITPTKIALEYSKERTYEEAELACLDKLLEIVEGIESQK